MSNQAFDVIYGRPNNLRNIQHGVIDNFKLKGFMENGKPSYILNREIGDDTLYLENLNINPTIFLRVLFFTIDKG